MMKHQQPTTVPYNYDNLLNHLQFLVQETDRLHNSGMDNYATLLLVRSATLVSQLCSALEDRTN